MRKSFQLSQIYRDLEEKGISVIGMTNPARNMDYYQNIFIMPNEHYMSFIVFGATSGFIFTVLLDIN